MIKINVSDPAIERAWREFLKQPLMSCHAFTLKNFDELIDKALAMDEKIYKAKNIKHSSYIKFEHERDLAMFLLKWS